MARKCVKTRLEACDLSAGMAVVESDWKISQRYWSESWFKATCVDRHKNGASVIRKLISDVRKGGLE